jgi:metallophosphoesterase (TIGR00282 family)
MSILRVLFIGDVVGEAGRAMFKKHGFALRKKYKIDAVVVNGENSSDQGRGITPGITQFFLDNGADVITTGNHIWYRRDVYGYLDETDKLLRPANFPPGVPGKGVTIITIKDHKIAIINLQGRVFMRELVDDPFRAADSILAYLKDKTNIIFVDMHAEATSEKTGIAYYLAGRVSGVVGTHTHIQTADERVLPGGTAYITDLGMVGALNSMLGMQKEAIMQNFLTQLPVKFSVDMNPPFVLCGAFIDVNMQTGRAVAIERVRVVDENM